MVKISFEFSLIYLIVTIVFIYSYFWDYTCFLTLVFGYVISQKVPGVGLTDTLFSSGLMVAIAFLLGVSLPLLLVGYTLEDYRC